MKSDLTAAGERNGPSSCDYAWLSSVIEVMHYWPETACIIYVD